MNRTDKVRKYRIGMRQILCMLAIAVLLDAGIAGSIPAAPRGTDQDNEVHLEKVHSLYWKAVLRHDVKKGKKVIAKRGSRVTVTYRRMHGKCRIEIGKKGKVSVPSSWLSFRKDLTTVEKEGDYNTATKEAFINRKTRVKKKEKYVIWVSLDKQRVNVFRADSGKWKLHRVYKCSTGDVGSPTAPGWHRVDYKHEWVQGLHWFTEVIGGGMHKWPGRIKKTLYGKHVASHGCIRMSGKNAKELYKMVKVRTRVLVY